MKQIKISSITAVVVLFCALGFSTKAQVLGSTLEPTGSISNNYCNSFPNKLSLKVGDVCPSIYVHDLNGNYMKTSRISRWQCIHVSSLSCGKFQDNIEELNELWNVLAINQNIDFISILGVEVHPATGTGCTINSDPTLYSTLGVVQPNTYEERKQNLAQSVDYLNSINVDLPQFPSYLDDIENHVYDFMMSNDTSGGYTPARFFLVSPDGVIVWAYDRNFTISGTDLVDVDLSWKTCRIKLLLLNSNKLYNEKPIDSATCSRAGCRARILCICWGT